MASFAGTEIRGDTGDNGDDNDDGSKKPKKGTGRIDRGKGTSYKSDDSGIGGRPESGGMRGGHGGSRDGHATFPTGLQTLPIPQKPQFSDSGFITEEPTSSTFKGKSQAKNPSKVSENPSVKKKASERDHSPTTPTTKSSGPVWWAPPNESISPNGKVLAQPCDMPHPQSVQSSVETRAAVSLKAKDDLYRPLPLSPTRFTMAVNTGDVQDVMSPRKTARKSSEEDYVLKRSESEYWKSAWPPHHLDTRSRYSSSDDEEASKAGEQRE